MRFFMSQFQFEYKIMSSNETWFLKKSIFNDYDFNIIL